MKSNRIMWLLVMLVVLATIVITTGAFDSRRQVGSGEQPQPTPDNGYKDMSRYAVVDYNEELSKDANELQKRKRANARYDGQEWVLKNPHPDDGGVGRVDETIPPEIIPVKESNLIVVGEITEANAHMSNDKQAVYSEFTIRVEEVFKNDFEKTVALGISIVADRMGGFVLYPNGQKIIYELSDKALPLPGNRYVFFLTSDKQSPNYAVLTLYELKNDGVVRLDYGRNFDEFKDSSKRTFLDAIRKKISLASQQSPK